MHEVQQVLHAPWLLNAVALVSPNNVWTAFVYLNALWVCNFKGLQRRLEFSCACTWTHLMGHCVSSVIPCPYAQVPALNTKLTCNTLSLLMFICC